MSDSIDEPNETRMEGTPKKVQATTEAARSSSIGAEPMWKTPDRHKRFEAHLARWETIMEEETSANRRAEHLTEADYAIRINTVD